MLTYPTDKENEVKGLNVYIKKNFEKANFAIEVKTVKICNQIKFQVNFGRKFTTFEEEEQVYIFLDGIHAAINL